MLISEEVNGKHVFSHYQEDQENTKNTFIKWVVKMSTNFFMKIEIGIMIAMTISNNKLVQDVQKLIKPSIVVI